MKKENKRTLFTFFVAIIVISGIISYSIWNEPHKDIKNATAIKTTATALYSNLTKDSVNMKSIFINKVVVVSGEVKQVSKNQKDQQVILLKTNIPDGAVNCTMEEKINSIKPHDTISIKGICSGYIGGEMDMGLPGDVFLIRCYHSF